MQQVPGSPSNGSTSIGRSASSREWLVELIMVAVVFSVSAGSYYLLFNRSNVLSHSIGYNLYASERVLEGAVPYRDFHTLYPPATFYLNAVFFKWLGVSLYSALLGVMIFRVLTVVVIYLSGRQMMPRTWALMASLSGLLWLRPNGPFKAVPMHYGALFLAVAMWLFLKYENRRKVVFLFLAGASLGLVALFKHNIGAYALAGSVVLLLFDAPRDVPQTSVCRGEPKGAPQRPSNKLKFVGHRSYARAFPLLGGWAAVVVPVLAYMQLNGALVPMIRTLLFGPGEFLLSRLAIPLSPVAPAVLVVALALSAYFGRKLRGRPALANGFSLILIVAISGFVLRGNQADVNQMIFYLPMLVLAMGLVTAMLVKSIRVSERRTLLIILIFSAAGLMELFPRFAREQSIAAMPFVMLFLFYLLYALSPTIRAFTASGSAGIPACLLIERYDAGRDACAPRRGGALQYQLALAVLPITFALIEGRLFFNTYFDGAFGFKAGTQVSIERGRGVYFPAATATLIDNAVGYIQQRVPEGVDAFAQSDAGTSLLFLANRRNISNAQFWIGVGVTQQERAATLERIDKSRIKLVITSDEVLAVEKYEPMRDYIERNFRPSIRFDDVLMLER